MRCADCGKTATRPGKSGPLRHRLTAEFLSVTEDRMLIDWPALRAAATAAAARGYAPYSRLHVGAAGQAADGRVVTGCNVENASCGLTLCAECGLVSALHATGGGRLTAVSVVAGDGAPLVPRGRARAAAAGRTDAGRVLRDRPGRAAGPAGGPARLTPPG